MDLNNLSGGIDPNAVAEQKGVFSLADLAAYDTSELNPLMTRLFAAGVHIFKVQETKLSERVSQDAAEPSLFSVNWKMECLEGNPISQEIDPETLVGKILNENYAFWPKQFEETVQLLMGRYKKMGLPFKGPLGGMTSEGLAPGWLDSVTNQIIKVRVRHATTQAGVDRAFYDWLPYEAAAE